MTQGEAVIRRSEAAFREQQSQISIWREACDYSLPVQIYQVGGNGTSYYRSNPDLVNDTAVQARRDLSSGMSNAFINAGEKWFEYQPSELLPNEAQKAAAEWFAHCTRIVWTSLPKSGFYDQAVVALDHSAAIGTSAMKIEGELEGSDSLLNCRTWDIGSFAIAENCAGIVDSVWREMEYTVAQSLQEWPDFQPDKYRQITDEKKLTQKEIFILEIRPRDKKEVERGMGQQKMPFEATVVHKELKEVVWRGGFNEFPVSVYRYERQASTTPWGIGPGVQALPAIRGVNYVDANIADGIDKMTNPAIAIKSDLRGTVDLRARGVIMLENLNDTPRVIHSPQNMQVGQAFLDKKENAVRRWFHSDLFAFFLNDDRFKTATVALQIASEKLGLFASFGYRFLNEWVEPNLERIFMVLFRQGAFGKAPKECLVRTTNGWEFVYPKIVQQSRMALALKEMAKQDVRQFMADMMPVWQIAPAEVERVNWSVASKLLGVNNVTMPGLIRTDEEYNQLMEQRAQQAQEQEQMKMAAQFATKNPEMAMTAAGAVGAANPA